MRKKRQRTFDLEKKSFFQYRFNLVIPILIFVFLMGLPCLACKGRKKDVLEYKWGINPESLPAVVTEKDFPKLEPGSPDRI